MPTNPAEDRALVPIREQEVEFYGDLIPAVEGPDAQVYIPLRPICAFLGLDWAGQYQRLKRDPVLSVALRTVRLSRSQSAGGAPEVISLPLKLLPGWLFGIQASRVKPELRDKILRYQADCYEVLWNAFKADILPALPPPADTSLAEQALVLAEAVANLARQQLALEQRYTTMAEYTRGFIQQTRTHQGQTNQRLAAHEERLQALELRLDPAATITEEQAAELALAVKNVGQRLVGQGDKSGYAKVYSELYRRYRISSYKNLPRAKFEEVLAWLHAWYEESGP
jgi:hypothetical protein